MGKQLLFIANDIAKDLKVRRPKITFDDRENTFLETSYVAGMTWINRINVSFPQLDLMGISHTFAIAHEMRHLWQIKSGILQMKSDHILWNGDRTLLYGETPGEHRTLPQEIDANDYAEQYVISLLSKSA